jgi:hypothetical protein
MNPNLNARQFEGHPYERQIGMVPTEVAHQYREYDRPVNESLKADIAAHGIREPLIMNYSKTTGEGMIGEGNHRLRIAKELGITHVPVRGLRQHAPISGNDPTSRRGRPLPVGPQKNDYVPQDLHPRELGLPVKE